MTKLVIFTVLCLISTLSANPITKSLPVSSFKSQDEDSYRLPQNTKPEHYTVHLTTRVDKKEDVFTGQVVIDLIVTDDETDHITIHQRQLDIKKVGLSCDGTEIEDPKHNYTEKTEFLRIELGKSLPKDTKCKLTIDYEGKLRTDNGGFYISKYTDKDGNERWLATTQFESTDARHAFPCYDEPGIRAKFDIIITHGGAKEGYHAISNTGIKENSTEDDTTTVTFETTPVMQPYLIAFVVSDFTFDELIETGKVPQRLYARKEAIDAGEGKYGVRAGVNILTEQAKYFNFPYDTTIGKMDQISIPDFQAGAMENWGLVTYRETALLYDEKIHALNYKRRVTGIIAHEFAHQWFGNLVAPEWWSYLWLNEGFATLYQYYTVSQLYPEFDQIGFHIFENHQNALESDALETTRPMTHNVEDPISIRNLFDDIAYDKSGSVLRMIQHALTDDVFKKGLTEYLNKKKYQAANSNDLADGLQEALKDVEGFPENIKMRDFIDSWSTKAGYPLVTVTRGDDNKITCTQKKFSYKVEKEEKKETWMIPINMATASSPLFNDTKPQLWLTGETATLDPPAPEPEPEIRKWTVDDWIVLNIQETGFYRVNYDDRLWNQIISKLNSDTFADIHEYNRAQLVDDIMNLARANIKQYKEVFRLLEYLKKEKSFVPWSSASSGLRYLQRQLVGSESYDYFNRFVREVVAPLFAEFGVDDGGDKESLRNKTSRSIGIDWACRTGDSKCITDTKERVQKVIETGEEIKSDIRSVVYCSGLREATEEDYNKIMERLEKQVDQAERTILINALGCIQNGDIQKKYLQSSIFDNSSVKYRIQERNLVLSSVYSNGQTGLENSIAFINEHHKEINEKYNPPSPVKNSVIRMSERVTSKALNEKFEELLETLTKAGDFTEEEKNKVLETPQENIKWTEDNEMEIRSYFKDYFKDAATVPMVSTLFLGVLLVIGYLLQ